MANRKKKCNPTKKSKITVWKKLCRAVRSMPKDLISSLVKAVLVILFLAEYHGMNFLLKLLAAFTMIYFLLPIDLVPDAIPYFGRLDDVLAGFVSRSITLKYQKHVEHRVRIKMKALHLY